MAPVGTMIAAHKDIGVCLTQAEYHGADSHDLSGTAFDNMTQATNVITDHAVLRGDGGARLIQKSGVLIDDSNNVLIPDGSSYLSTRFLRAAGAAGLYLEAADGTDALWITDDGDVQVVGPYFILNSYGVNDISNDPLLAGADAEALVTEYAAAGAISGLRYEISFVDGDLVAGDLIVVHNLGTTRPTHCMVYDNSGNPIQCGWTVTDGNTAVLKLAVEQTVRGGALTGTWYAKVLK